MSVSVSEGREGSVQPDLIDHTPARYRVGDGVERYAIQIAHSPPIEPFAPPPAWSRRAAEQEAARSPSAEGANVRRDLLQGAQAMEARYADRPERARRLAPLQLGLHLTRAAIEFWTSVAQHPPPVGG